MASDQSFRRGWTAALEHTIGEPVIAVVMGVSGSGKTTVPALLAAALVASFRREMTCIRPRTWRRCMPARH